MVSMTRFTRTTSRPTSTTSAALRSVAGEQGRCQDFCPQGQQRGSAAWRVRRQDNCGLSGQVKKVLCLLDCPGLGSRTCWDEGARHQSRSVKINKSRAIVRVGNPGRRRARITWPPMTQLETKSRGLQPCLAPSVSLPTETEEFDSPAPYPCLPMRYRNRITSTIVTLLCLQGLTASAGTIGYEALDGNRCSVTTDPSRQLEFSSGYSEQLGSNASVTLSIPLGDSTAAARKNCIKFARKDQARQHFAWLLEMYEQGVITRQALEAEAVRLGMELAPESKAPYGSSSVIIKP